jgi:endonuclease/exonuclease/phosphatase family metal-dependent hydrolase
MALVTQITWSERPLIAYNVHLESRGSDALRCSQFAEVIDDTNSLAPDIPVLIAGDFNFDLVQQDPASLVANVSRVEAPFENPFDNGNLRATTTRPRLGRARSIDWILVRADVQWNTPRLHDDVIASDHFPLSLVMKRN